MWRKNENYWKILPSQAQQKNIPPDNYFVIWNALLIVWVYIDLVDDSKTEPSVIRKTAIDQTQAKKISYQNSFVETLGKRVPFQNRNLMPKEITKW